MGMLIGLELMINGAGLSIVAAAQLTEGDAVRGQLAALFVMGLAAAEATLMLAIILVVVKQFKAFKNRWYVPNGEGSFNVTPNPDIINSIRPLIPVAVTFAAPFLIRLMAKKEKPAGSCFLYLRIHRFSCRGLHGARHPGRKNLHLHPVSHPSRHHR